MSCLLWDRFTSAYPAQAWPREAGFSSLQSTACWCSWKSSWESQPCFRGMTPTMKAEIAPERGVCGEKMRRARSAKVKPWVCSRSCASCPSIEARLWPQSCSQSMDAGGQLEVRPPQALLGLRHSPSKPPNQGECRSLAPLARLLLCADSRAFVPGMSLS